MTNILHHPTSMHPISSLNSNKISTLKKVKDFVETSMPSADRGSNGRKLKPTDSARSLCLAGNSSN